MCVFVKLYMPRHMFKVSNMSTPAAHIVQMMKVVAKTVALQELALQNMTLQLASLRGHNVGTTLSPALEAPVLFSPISVHTVTDLSEATGQDDQPGWPFHGDLPG